ncbi:plasmid stabilization system [Tolypothrix sp. NIES-4075]|uniref:hypothetical protein n=1 Tax=Tolypothrix sp. NIES-4075 TaxID=2005459 RepID=UPI000B6935CE|nr:hypothetical protein [Tolypothrix sp. NIES-4075]GAX41596.1 plasmid stabilization system [Tolypothrix sp. NIES-4075]
MSQVNKRPQVIRDLIELATYIAEDNLDATEPFSCSSRGNIQAVGEYARDGKTVPILKS